MTRKDYVLLANVLANSRKATQWVDDSVLALNMLTVNMAQALKVDNELFDYDRFLKAAGFPGEVKA